MTGIHTLLSDGTLGIVVAFAAVSDVTTRRIPNWLTVCGVLIGFLINGCTAGWGGMGTSLEGMGLALAVYLPLFAIRALGAGDVKLMAAVGSITGPLPWFCIFVLTCMVGGLLALVVVISKRRLIETFFNTLLIARSLLTARNPASQKPEMDFRSPAAVTLPHGLSIALATLVTISLGRLQIL